MRDARERGPAHADISNMNTHHHETGPDDRAADSDHPNDGDTGFFYWQLPAKRLEQLRAQNAIFEEEGYLAHDINWGRRLLDTPADPASVPDVSNTWPGLPTPEHLADAISAILQVAVELEVDPEDVCAQALRMHRLIRRDASRAVQRH